MNHSSNVSLYVFFRCLPYIFYDLVFKFILILNDFISIYGSCEIFHIVKLNQFYLKTVYFFRYFVKTHSLDFDSEAVYEEYKEDSKILPCYDGKVLVKIEKRDDMDLNKSTGSDKKYQL